MKLKKFFALAVGMLLSAGAWAQTDVTSTYLTNADFSETTALTVNLLGYGKDITKDPTAVYGFQAVDGWSSKVLNGDNSNATYPNSGMGGAVFAYNSSSLMKGNTKAAPTADPNGNASGNCFGFFGVWGCGGYYYQDVTFPAGKYTITIPMYSQSGTQANTSYTGFFADGGASYTVAVNPTVGSWVTQTVTFTLTAETEGEIRLGYLSTGGGSGANPMLFIDCVKIEFTAQVVKDVLSTAITAATSANASLSNSDLAAAITTAQAVYDDADATQDEVNAAAETLNAAVITAMSAAGDATFFLTNPGFETCTETTDNAAAGASAAPLNIDGSWTQVNSATWSSSAVVSYGGSGQVNGVSAPASDNKSNAGKTLGVSVGWGGTVTYKSETVTLPAGAYTATIYGYNANSGATYFKSQFGFVPTSGTNYMSTKTSFAASTWEADQVSFELTDATEGYFLVGGTAKGDGGSGSNAKVFFDNLTLTYSNPLAAAKTAWQEALAAAQTAIANSDYANVTGTERTALQTEIDKDEPTSKTGYEEAKTNLETATSTFAAAKDSYDALAAINAVAAEVGVTTVTATTASDAVTAAQNQNVSVYTQITADYAYPVTLGDWTITGASQNNAGQHWDGTSTTTYYEPNQWGSASVAWSMSQEKVLPAGTYVLMATGRRSADLDLSMTVLDGSNTVGTVSDFPAQGSGLGVDTDGAANFATAGTYANSNNGYGWEWRYIPFTLTGETTLTLSVEASSATTHQWASICDFTLLSTAEVNAHKLALSQAITDAAAVDVTTNVGDAVFQIPATAVTTLQSAISAAETVRDASGITDDEYDAATTALNDAVTAYENTALNAPDASVHYYINVATSGHPYVGFPVKVVSGSTTANNPTGYAINATSPATDYLSQAFTFTSANDAEHPNYYYISVERPEGIVYLTNGTTNGSKAGWSDSQIQATTEESNKLAFEIKTSNVDGAFYIYNIATNSAVDCQGGGSLYTEVGGHPFFSVSEAAAASVPVMISADKYATRIFPFTPTAIDGVTYYTCSAAEGDVLTLVEVAETDLAANVPYILLASTAVNTTLTGYGMGDTNTYTTGLLTGYYTSGYTVPTGSYVLQTQSGVQGFYQVDSEISGSANRCYLTAPSSGVKAFYFAGNTETAIQNLEDAQGAQDGAIFNLAGQRVSKAVKGIYVINGKKVVK